MLPISLRMACIASILISILFIPVTVSAATSLQFNFDTTILETTGSSPLNVGDAVQGALAINAVDYVGSGSDTIDVFGSSLTLNADIYQGGNTWGWANGPSWSQATPGYGIGLTVLNNYTLPAGAMGDLPGYVTPGMFPNLPSDGDVIDAIILVIVSNDLLTSSQEKMFGVAFMYDVADNVVTGSGLGGIDANQILSSAIYGEFFADATDAATDIVIWEAGGPIGASAAPAPVPVPAAVWLFGSGLFGLIGFARKRIA